MEELHGEKEGQLEKEGKPEDKVEHEDEEKSDKEDKQDKKAKPAREGELEDKAEPDEQGQPGDEGKTEKQGKSDWEGKREGEGKPDSQAKSASEPRAAEKRPAEDYVPRKAKRKTDRGTDDSPKDSQEGLQDRHVSSEEMMRECADVSRAQEELRKRQKMGGFPWMQRDAQDAFAPRGQRGVRGARGGGRAKGAYMISRTFNAFGPSSLTSQMRILLALLSLVDSCRVLCFNLEPILCFRCHCPYQQLFDPTTVLSVV